MTLSRYFYLLSYKYHISCELHDKILCIIAKGSLLTSLSFSNMALDNLITMVKYIFVYDNFKDPIIRILVTTNVLMLNVAIYLAHIRIIICFLVFTK